MSPPAIFLTAQWRHLAMLNYRVERAILEPLVPAGTILDTFQDQAYVSVVGFLFLKTRVWGLSIPFHQDFEELNLRFYVRRQSAGQWRRGVVFIKEIVPKFAIATVARLYYDENYVALPMRHALEFSTEGVPTSVEYGWQFQGHWNHLRVRTLGDAAQPSSGSTHEIPLPTIAASPSLTVISRPGLEEFITEHYWGYTRQKDGGCLEYEVAHPRWRVWPVAEASFHCDAAGLYGRQFADALNAPPASAFLADGSAVTVYRGHRLAPK